MKRFWKGGEDKPGETSLSKASDKVGFVCPSFVPKFSSLATAQESTVLRELRILQLVTGHRNICELIGGFKLLGAPGVSVGQPEYAIVMSFVDGGELYTAANRFVFSEPEVAHVISEILTGVECAFSPPPLPPQCCVQKPVCV